MARNPRKCPLCTKFGACTGECGSWKSRTEELFQDILPNENPEQRRDWEK